MTIKKDIKNNVEDLLGSKARVRILKTLAESNELTISLIIKNTRLNYSSVSKHLNYLKILDFVQEKKFGRIRIYRYKSENPKARHLKEFFEMWQD